MVIVVVVVVVVVVLEVVLVAASGRSKLFVATLPQCGRVKCKI